MLEATKPSRMRRSDSPRRHLLGKIHCCPGSDVVQSVALFWTLRTQSAPCRPDLHTAVRLVSSPAAVSFGPTRCVAASSLVKSLPVCVCVCVFKQFLPCVCFRVNVSSSVRTRAGSESLCFSSRSDPAVRCLHVLHLFQRVLYGPFGATATPVGRFCSRPGCWTEPVLTGCRKRDDTGPVFIFFVTFASLCGSFCSETEPNQRSGSRVQTAKRCRLTQSAAENLAFTSRTFILIRYQNKNRVGPSCLDRVLLQRKAGNGTSLSVFTSAAGSGSDSGPRSGSGSDSGPSSGSGSDSGPSSVSGSGPRAWKSR
ncbi:uncharacterized protein LOC106940553 [Poecilia latipinna]|uniref:uncharacterized protein LOC106940553 n=1 Tax=Poecilia latipinna TaxID=48699 RepID=UPI00072EB8AE|nr:PREDICTED: uncharacterized protein LOC106940553 [Poecilia latipinna]